MGFYERDGARIHYTVTGDPEGPPLLLIAPGGMRSSIEAWASRPWSPLDRLTEYRLIAMDQRNAGHSTAPVSAQDGWDTYTADQLGLLDHLGIDDFRVLGMCIGGPYSMGLIHAAPERVRGAVIFQPIGLDGNRKLFFDLFDTWASELAPGHPEADAAAWAAYRQAMFGGDFMFNTSRSDAAACTTPILLFMGDDPYHPQSISRALAELAENVTFVEDWKTDFETTERVVKSFLGALE